MISKYSILKEIVNNEDLRKLYWPDIDPKSINLDNLRMFNNRYLNVLGELINETRTDRLNAMYNRILNEFEL